MGPHWSDHPSGQWPGSQSWPGAHSWPTGPPSQYTDTDWSPPTPYASLDYTESQWTTSTSTRAIATSTPVAESWRTLTYNTQTTPKWVTASSSSSSYPTAIQEHKAPILQHGVLAAAIVLPIAAIACAIAVFVFFLRYRARHKREATTAAFVAPVGMKEKKLGSFRRRPNPSAVEAPVMMSDQNNAYFTGLDTSSFGSRPSSSGDVPPPYARDVSPPPPISTETRSIRSDEDAGEVRNPFETPNGSQLGLGSPTEATERRVSEDGELYRPG